jgi:hypothetical protein
VASQRLISDKVRLVYKAAAAQSAEKSRVQASCTVDIFRATDKAGQWSDESCLTGCFNSDAILKVAAAEGIDPWFLRNQLDRSAGRNWFHASYDEEQWPYHTSIPNHCCCWQHSCICMTYTRIFHALWPVADGKSGASPQQFAVHSENCGLCKFVHPYIVYTQLILKISLCLCLNLAVIDDRQKGKKM